jgi:hypothetical protein
MYDARISYAVRVIAKLHIFYSFHSRVGNQTRVTMIKVPFQINMYTFMKHITILAEYQNVFDCNEFEFNPRWILMTIIISHALL